MNVLSRFRALKASKKNAFALLIDPDSCSLRDVETLASISMESEVDFFFVGGSIMVNNHTETCVSLLKDNTDIPVVLFPGNPNQVVNNADGLLYLSLISGRNPDLLIGQHVSSAPLVKQSGLEVISTGYMVVDGGVPTTVSYMSHSAPIPANKPDIALCTAWAGELQGKHVIYMDAGSGARNPISEKMIQKVASGIEVPLIIGGGIRTPEKVEANYKAGAQVVVVGNAIEKDPGLLKELAAAKKAVY